MRKAQLPGMISPHGIYDLAEFMQCCRVGRTFWSIEFRIRGGPHRVIGPCTIEQLEGQGLAMKVHYSEPGQEPDLFVLGDLLNDFHGVFLSSDAAKKHFDRWSTACKRDATYRNALQGEPITAGR